MTALQHLPSSCMLHAAEGAPLPLLPPRWMSLLTCRWSQAHNATTSASRRDTGVCVDTRTYHGQAHHTCFDAADAYLCRIHCSSAMVFAHADASHIEAWPYSTGHAAGNDLRKAVNLEYATCSSSRTNSLPQDAPALRHPSSPLLLGSACTFGSHFHVLRQASTV